MKKGTSLLVVDYQQIGARNFGYLFFGNMVPFLGEEGGFKKGTGGSLREQGGNEGSNPAGSAQTPFCIYRLTG